MKKEIANAISDNRLGSLDRLPFYFMSIFYFALLIAFLTASLKPSDV